MNPEYIILHHSLTKDSETVSWGVIRKYHVHDLGWRDIGYHFGVELLRGDYEILMGRMMTDSGAHCPQGGMNGKSLGVCFIGNFDEAPPATGLWKLGIKLVSSLCSIFDIPRDHVGGHREYNPAKTCPGKLFDLDVFRTDLKWSNSALRNGGY